MEQKKTLTVTLLVFASLKQEAGAATVFQLLEKNLLFCFVALWWICHKRKENGKGQFLAYTKEAGTLCSSKSKPE